jgi:hypothetical protein
LTVSWVVVAVGDRVMVVDSSGLDWVIVEFGRAGSLPPHPAAASTTITMGMT